MGKLTTHVLDIYNGYPAAGMNIELWQLGDSRDLLLSVTTNDDGRVDNPLLDDASIKEGEYELVFFVRDYFEGKGGDSPFLSTVPIRFNIFNATQHYHVPLLVSPWAFQTYRGS